MVLVFKSVHSVDWLCLKELKFEFQVIDNFVPLMPAFPIHVASMHSHFSIEQFRLIKRVTLTFDLAAFAQSVLKGFRCNCCSFGHRFISVVVKR